MSTHRNLFFWASLLHRVHAFSCAPILLSGLASVVALPIALFTGAWRYLLLAVSLAFASLALWVLSQVFGSAAAWMLHQRIGTRASLSEHGLDLSGEFLSAPRSVAWSELARVRRAYARSFPVPELRFRDEPAYELLLASGEVEWIDLVDEAALRSQCQARGIPLLDFEKRISSHCDEVLGEQQQA